MAAPTRHITRLTGLAVIVGGYGLGHIWDTVSPEAALRLSAAGSVLACLILGVTLVRFRRRPATVWSVPTTAN